jgi:hypothetical protein
MAAALGVFAGVRSQRKVNMPAAVRARQTNAAATQYARERAIDDRNPV